MWRVVSRFRHGWHKYGWRLAPLTLVRAAKVFVRLRWAWRRLKLRILCRAQVGSGTRIENACSFSPGAPLHIGQQVYIGRHSTFSISELSPTGDNCVLIGDCTWLSDGFMLVSTCGIHIGSDVLIGEYVSVRDATHAYARPDVPIRRQGDIYGTVIIEDDVWIGRGCLVQGRPEGVVIGRGAVIAANSVVTRSVPPLEVWGGAPARFLKVRSDAPLPTEPYGANK